MQCLSPSSIRRPGQADARDRITIPCGKCAACLSNRRSDWAVRLEQEFRVSENAHFLTLTYSDEHLCYGAISEFATLVRSDIQLFMKRLRKRCDSKLKYYVAGEYGSRTYRPHYHAIIFNLPDNNVELLLKTWQKVTCMWELLLLLLFVIHLSICCKQIIRVIQMRFRNLFLLCRRIWESPIFQSVLNGIGQISLDLMFRLKAGKSSSSSLLSR